MGRGTWSQGTRSQAQAEKSASATHRQFNFKLKNAKLQLCQI